MLSVRHLSREVAWGLYDRLLPDVTYDAEGLYSRWLAEAPGDVPPDLARVAALLCPGKVFRAVALRGYRDGLAATPCHSDRGQGFTLIVSLGAARTFRVHKGACDDPTDVVRLECVNGMAVLMSEEFHNDWHHQLAPDPGVTGERLSLVYRTQPTGR